MDFNFFLIIIMVFLHFGGILLFYYFFREIGLFIFIPIAVIIANIQVLKLVDIFSLTTALGNVAYGSTFLISDILSENHGESQARKSVLVGFFSLIFFTIVLYLTTKFIPNVQDTSQEHLSALFDFLPRIVVSGLLTYMISQNFDVWFYFVLKRRFQKYLFIRNNVSTSISQFLDTFLFSYFAFGFHIDMGFIKVDPVYNWSVIWQIILVAYVIKVLVAVFDTPFIYIARRMKEKKFFYKGFID